MTSYGCAFLLFLVFSVTSTRASAECLAFTALPKHFLDVRGASNETRIRFVPAGEQGYLLQNEASCSPTGRCDSTLYLPDAKRCYREVLSFRGRWIGSSGIVSAGEMGRVPARIRFELDPPGGEAEFRFDRKNGSYVEVRERKRRR